MQGNDVGGEGGILRLQAGQRIIFAERRRRDIAGTALEHWRYFQQTFSAGFFGSMAAIILNVEDTEDSIKKCVGDMCKAVFEENKIGRAHV